MNKFKVDVIVGLQSGDEGKGKVTHHLLKSGKYTHCVRYNGGGNAGHTVYDEAGNPKPALGTCEKADLS